MDDNTRNHGDAAHRGNEYIVSNRVMELVVAAMFMILAAVVMYDNHRIGSGWGADGPQAGYFPFYMGLLMFISGAGVFVSNVITKHPDMATFVERTQLKLVMQILIPTIVLVIAIDFLGLYVSSAIFIAFFMLYLGKYPLRIVLPVSIGVPLALFILFETQFLVPLPKGPLEAALGY